MDRQIYIQTQFTGYHRWDAAPDCVAFLRNAHRHIFHVKVTVAVSHNDRDIEFFMMKQIVDNFIQRQIIENANKDENMGSCEQMAEKIVIFISKHYERTVEVEVNEDTENGAIVNYP